MARGEISLAVSARILWVPKATRKWAIATGLEAFLDTATQDALGAGRTSLGPQVFAPIFNFLGVEGMLFSPAYQYVFDIAGDGRLRIRKVGYQSVQHLDEGMHNHGTTELGLQCHPGRFVEEFRTDLHPVVDDVG